MIKDGEVVIVDEFTGRLMPGRRWSDGLHQAVEAKEKVKIERENQTLATITFQNYFRKYEQALRHDRHGGDRGRGVREDLQPRRRGGAAEPAAPARGAARTRSTGRRREKYDAIVADIQEQQDGRAARRWSARCRSRSPRSSPGMLRKRGVKHVVLNAKFHAQEAEIVAQAGRFGAVTIATNMAGRGTDILLGGNAEFMARQKCLADELAERLPKGEEKFIDDDEFVYFHHLDAFYRVRAAGLGPHRRALQGAVRRRARAGRRRSAACTSSAPSATRRGASTTSCAAAPAARATRARRASTCRSKTT